MNVLPELPPLLRRSEVELHVAALHAIADDVWSDWHRERNWLDKHRFYLSEEQCAQANRDLGKLKAASEEEGLLWWPEKGLAPDPRMNDSFFEPEDWSTSPCEGRALATSARESTLSARGRRVGDEIASDKLTAYLAGGGEPRVVVTRRATRRRERDAHGGHDP